MSWRSGKGQELSVCILHTEGIVYSFSVVKARPPVAKCMAYLVRASSRPLLSSNRGGVFVRKQNWTQLFCL